MNGTQELHELFRSTNRKSVDGVSDDVGMNMFAEMKPYPDSAWARIRIVVWHRWDAAKV